jgi:hypothetical protein
MNRVASLRKYVTAPAGLVALSRVVVGHEMEAEVKAAFRERPHRVDCMTGFLRMEVPCPLERPQQIPKGMKVFGRETNLREFEVGCE